MFPTRRIRLIAGSCLLAGAVAVSSSALAGKLYKWVDADGNVSYQDMPPPDGETYKTTNLSDKKLGALKSETGETKMSDLAASTPITVYSVQDCDSCDTVKAYLQTRSIPFQDKMIDGNEELKQELLAKAKKMQVPALTVGDKVVFGYRRSEIESALSASGYPVKQAAEKTDAQDDKKAVSSN